MRDGRKAVLNNGKIFIEGKKISLRGLRVTSWTILEEPVAGILTWYYDAGQIYVVSLKGLIVPEGSFHEFVPPFPGGRYALLSSLEGNTLTRWDLETGESAPLPERDNTLGYMAFVSPTSFLLSYTTGEEDDTVTDLVNVLDGSSKRVEDVGWLCSEYDRYIGRDEKGRHVVERDREGLEFCDDDFKKIDAVEPRGRVHMVDSRFSTLHGRVWTLWDGQFERPLLRVKTETELYGPFSHVIPKRETKIVRCMNQELYSGLLVADLINLVSRYV